MNDISTYNIKASSHIITLLGDELIGSNSLALFELVKNSYDADASKVSITFNNLLNGDGSIIIEDNGQGMLPEIVKNAWLVIGTDYKRKEIKVSSHKKRTSLGNKGVGRLAVHHLANSILLETQSEGTMFGSRLKINWNDLIKSNNFIDGLSVNVNNTANTRFRDGHGTKIVLSELREKRWTKAKICEMVDKLQNIKNPFSHTDDFIIEISSNESKVKEWIDSVKSPFDLITSSLFQFKFKLHKSKINDNCKFSWSYKFNPTNIPLIKTSLANQEKSDDFLPINYKDIISSLTEERKLLKNEDLNGIEYIEGEFYSYILDSKIINYTFGSGSIGRVKDFVSSNAGIKIFRDNMRVFNYGEPTDDWLGLDQQKMKRAASHFAKGQTTGAINLRLSDTSKTLLEKTNREGFIENDYFNNLTVIVQSIFNFFERLSISDREIIKAFSNNITLQKKIGFSESINELESKLKKKNLENEFAGVVKKVKHDYDNMRDVMLNSGMSGLNLTLIFHEVEREMGFINTDISKRYCNVENIKMRIKGLMDLLEKFTPLMKKNTTSRIKASAIIEHALSIHINRFSFHDIILSEPLKSGDTWDFEVMGSGGLLMGALSNIIDNAIYWVSRKKEEIGNNFQPAIRITTDLENFDGPAIVIADNGSGFQLPPEEVILPFRTLKPNGMGVGLYYVNLVMEMSGGKLLFINKEDANLPDAYSGACLALVFKSLK